jgi:hypothetical protein
LYYVFLTSLCYADGWLESVEPDAYSGWACEFGNSGYVGIHVWRDDGLFLGGGNAALNREDAVKNACNSEHSSHGFNLKFDLPNHVYDGNYHSVSVYAIFDDGSNELLGNSPVNILFVDKSIPPRPTRIGMVVGRDLDYPYPLSIQGHVGIWDGYRVIEVFNDNSNRKNRVQKISWEEFSRETKAWPNVNKDLPDYYISTCIKEYCAENPLDYEETRSRLKVYKAIIKRAEQIMVIGASYTYSATPTPAKPGTLVPVINPKCYSGPFSTTSGGGVAGNSSSCIIGYKENLKPIPGVYRCDSFVVDAYASTAQTRYALSSFQTSLSFYNNQRKQQESWQKNMVELANMFRTPNRIYGKIKDGMW